jgi:hypothetical protein
MLFRTMIVVGLIMAGPTAALAQGNPSGADADARKARHQQRIAAYDKNKDGKLDDAERAALRRDRMAERFAKLDADRNGSISWAEFEKARVEHRDRGRRGVHGRKRFRCGGDGAVGGEAAPASLIY